MDDSCAVCADTLEWVAYGPCGHKDVCSTCVARLRFICDDRRCCICKTESDVVFVTKALGDYTRNINDFSVLPAQAKEGRVGSYWYHEDTQAFFDDTDQYKMVKAMCRLSCSVCDKMDETPTADGSASRKRTTKFRNVDQLKGHLFHGHRLLMCSLCLEGRKVFICEQKLYTRPQLNQHIHTGDSEVDGSESERGGFMGHPLCEFCRTPFYGDNELYTHMSTEHYTCHICQRQHPGQYEYYKNYDDLENHFRGNHFLCEDDSCLAKKFIVFPSESELKRHNTLEHGGHMSRSQRNAALQIPTSFRYRRYNEQENRRGRARSFRRDTSDSELSMAIQASLETANPDGGGLNNASSSSARVASDQRETSDIDPLVSPFESLTTTDSVRYLQAVSQNARNSRIEESAFPPLPTGSQQRSQPDASVKNSMAAHLRRQNNKTVKNVPSSSTGWPAASRTAAPSLVSPQRGWPALGNASGSASSSGQTKSAIDNRPTQSSYSSSIQARHALVSESPAAGSGGSSRNRGSTRSMSHSASAPSLVETGGSFDSTSDFPPVSAVQVRKPSGNGQARASVENVHTANKSLVERIRTALNFDEDKYTEFKNMSGEYRQGLMDAATYLVYVEQFGLSHLVLELARLCPDPQKQKELVDMHLANLPQENGWNNGIHLKDNGKSMKKGKGKSFDAAGGSSTSKDDLVDNFASTVRKLQSGYKPPSEDDVEVLSKDGYRGAKGKPKLVISERKAEVSSHGGGEGLKLKGPNEPSSVNGGSSNHTSGENDGKSKQRKKTSKFHRLRLGNDSAEAILGASNTNSDPDPDTNPKDTGGVSNTSEGLPVRGVWRNKGGQKLVSMTTRGPKN